MKDHTIRCLKTLSCLPRYPGRITTPEIHRRLRDEGFAVSLRTIQRDLESLSGAFPIGSEPQGRSLAWYWAGEATLFSIPAMDAYTALTFLLAEANMQALFPAGIMASMTPYFDAARDVLKKRDRRHLKNWKEKIRFVARGQPLRPAAVRPEVVKAVHEALLQDKRLLARYRKREESRGKEREINPLALLHGDSVSYLVCSFGDYTDVWHLPLHRFSAARLLAKPATRPAGFDLEEYLSEEQALQYPWGGEIRLDALFDAEAAAHLRETRLSVRQTLRSCPDGWVRVTATVRDTLQLRWWLLGFGEQVEVIGPETLREEFAETAREMHRLYGRQGNEFTTDN